MTYSLLDLLILRAVVLLVRAQGPIGRLKDVIGRHKQNNPAPAPQAAVAPLAHRCDSESEVELVCMRPAKRARVPVKVETLLQNVLPVKQEGVKQEVVLHATGMSAKSANP